MKMGIYYVGLAWYNVNAGFIYNRRISKSIMSFMAPHFLRNVIPVTIYSPVLLKKNSIRRKITATHPKSGGILGLLDKACMSTKLLHEIFASTLYYKFQTHKRFVKSELCYTDLKICHYADEDVSNLTNFIQRSIGITLEEEQLSVSGHNWGEVDIKGNMLTFLVGSKQAFEISLADVAQTQLQGKTDVYMEFHLDDTTGATEKDSLMDLSFHIPNSSTQFVGDDNHPPAQVFLDKIVSMADVGSGEEAVVTFEGISILTPRGCYNVELHLSFLRLQGHANDYKIQYSSVVRIFRLPKSKQLFTFVVITLDPPIRKGQTLYPHIVLQFETENVVQGTLSISEELLSTKYKGKLVETSFKEKIGSSSGRLLQRKSISSPPCYVAERWQMQAD